jgi:AraC family transcriptional regulator
MNKQIATELKIVEKPAFKVMGMLYHGKPMSKEIPELWNQFGPRMDSVPHAVNPAVSYGVCKDMDMETGEFDYAACVEVNSMADAPAGMVAFEVPAATYAVFPATLANIGEVYMTASDKALPAAGYHHSAGYDLEVYDEQFDPEQPGSTFNLYIPIEK